MPTSTPGSKAARPARPAAGFSLFELLVVLILISLAAALVMPSFSRGVRALELKAAARDLATRMKKVRSRAIAHQKVFRMFMERDPDKGDFYLLADEYGQELGRYPLPEGVRFTLADEELPLRVDFYPNGRSSGAELELRSREGRQAHVEVDLITGLARVGRRER